MNSTQFHSMASEALQNKPVKKSVQLVQEQVTLADGQLFTPMPIQSPRDALRATLLMLFKHVGDIHVTIVEIMADKFNLNVDDIHNAIKDDPRWTDMLMNPLVHDLTQAALANAVPPPAPKADLVMISPEQKAKKPRKPRQPKQPKAVKKVMPVPDEDELVFD